MNPNLPKFRPLPVKDRISTAFVSYGKVDVENGAFVVVDKNGVRTQIPAGALTVILLEPGTTVTHEAVKLASLAGTLILWVGEAAIRLYSAGQPGGARSDRLLYQAELALNESLRLKVVGKMFEMRFGEKPPAKRSVNQLRGIEGYRVKQVYSDLARKYKVKWNNRSYDPSNWDLSDELNRCISTATSCLYGITEAAVLAAGYAPAIGFLHTGKPLSFVYDIADIYKMETVVPLAFKTYAENPDRDAHRLTRYACRDAFRKKGLLKRIINEIEDVLAAGEIQKPEPYDDMVFPAIPNPEQSGDPGHRNK